MEWEQIKRDREEYLDKLRKWLEEARLWYSLSSGFPNSIPGFSFPSEGAQNSTQQNPYAAFYQSPGIGQNIGNGFQNNQNSGVLFYQTYQLTLRLPQTFEFKIPPLWKRLCAELIDICILLTLKLFIIFVFMESFNIGNAWDLYGLEAVQKGLIEGQELNYSLAFELILLEFIHRFILCLFETYFLQGKTCATPGKRCMGLMVVQVDNLNLIPNRPTETVSATGVKALVWQRALLRSILKHLIVGLLLPLAITFYIFPFNRTSYDMMCNTVVVEAHPEFLLYQAVTVR